MIEQLSTCYKQTHLVLKNMMNCLEFSREVLGANCVLVYFLVQMCYPWRYCGRLSWSWSRTVNCSCHTDDNNSQVFFCINEALGGENPIRHYRKLNFYMKNSCGTNDDERFSLWPKWVGWRFLEVNDASILIFGKAVG